MAIFLSGIDTSHLNTAFFFFIISIINTVKESEKQLLDPVSGQISVGVRGVW